MRVVLLAAVMAINLFAASDVANCSLEKSMKPLCYHKHLRPELNVALLHYGRAMKIADLQRIAPILKERFIKATGGNLSLNILDMKVMDYKNSYPSDYKVKDITDPKRLQRIWYYDTLGAKVMTEIYEQYKVNTNKKIVRRLDAILSITGAQFNGLGFANGRVSVTEYPREIAWAIPGGGRVDYPTDYQLVDELIHELGHNMFLGHTSTQCQKQGMTLEQRKVCCENSANKNDVLSYCRKRANVNEDFMHGFEKCNRDMIAKKITPAILNGGSWRIKNRTKCL